MKKYIFFLLLLPAFGGAELDVKIHAESAILMNADTGAIIFEKKPHTPLYPASITKIATALYALELLGEDLDKTTTATREAVASITEKERERTNFTANPHWIEVGGTHIGLKAGEVMSYRDLLYGMMLVSGNDAANTIAGGLGEGSIDTFMNGMNEYLQKIGCKNTHFVCAHGHHHPKHITTAYDMALIGKEAMKHPVFKQIVSSQNYVRPETNKQKAITLAQGNKLVKKGSNFYYDKATGIKTGHGSYAKDTLVASASKNGRNLIAVLLKSEQRRHNFEDAVKLFEAAFNQPKLSQTLVHAGAQKYTLQLPGSSSNLKTYTTEGFKHEFYQGEKPELHVWLKWDKNLSLPFEKDQKIGELAIQGTDKKIVKRIPLFAESAVQLSWKEKVRRFFAFEGSGIEYLIAGLLLLLLVLVPYLFFRRR